MRLSNNTHSTKLNMADSDTALGHPDLYVHAECSGTDVNIAYSNTYKEHQSSSINNNDIDLSVNLVL